MTPVPHRSGFIGIVGRPNVGKSTLLNTLLGEKVAITSPRPQTTRQRILGVLTQPDAQLVFLDSPGLHQPEHALGRYMVEVAKAVMDEADVLVVVVDAIAGLTPDDERVFAQVSRWAAEASRPGRAAVLAVNKIDAVRKPRVLPIMEGAARRGCFAACVPVSAQTGDQVDVLVREIASRLPEGPRWYEPEQRTDQTTSQLTSELIREQILLATRQEVPHAVAVLVDSIEARDQVTAVQATIVVERAGQKAILIGRGGSMLKRIGSSARRELERLHGRKVFLGLWVKVAADWRGDERMLRQLGYSPGAA